MWVNNHWERITAEEAARLHPGGTVSASSGLFMCELCGQYVTLTDGTVKKRYFRHSAYEKSKNCPERTFGSNYQIPSNPLEHELPIRITDIKPNSFRFELGLIRAPISSLSKEFCVEIRATGSSRAFVYEKEKLNCNSITYLPIGKQPFEKYKLNIIRGNDNLRNFWPEDINGMDPYGTLFDKASGRKLTIDADVEIQKEYYLLKRGPVVYSSDSSISIKKISQQQFGFAKWILYTVCATKFNEYAAKFFLELHCRLTDQPVSMTMLWPLYTGEKYTVKHNRNMTYMLVRGNVAAFHSFPSTTILQFNHPGGKAKLYAIPSRSRQQLISAGRTQTLQYVYFWKEPLNQEESLPDISVTDLNGAEIASGETNQLPLEKTLLIKSAVNGELIISQNDRIMEKRKICAGKTAEQNDLAYGIQVQIVIGLDVIWQIHFSRPKVTRSESDAELLRQLQNASGPAIPASHSLRNILAGMQRYPMVCQWIRKCIQTGRIREQSYRKLQKFYLNISSNKVGKLNNEQY